MITRIVRMEFQPEKVDDFLEVFRSFMLQIRHFPGVRHLELYRDASQPHVFYTYSLWEAEDALEAYRHSDLFKSVWGQTKVLFADKPEAFTLLKEIVVD